MHFLFLSDQNFSQICDKVFSQVSGVWQDPDPETLNTET
jgi:hypothetical protein